MRLASRCGKAMFMIFRGMIQKKFGKKVGMSMMGSVATCAWLLRLWSLQSMSC